MKNHDILSALTGGIFFAIPYLTLSVPVIPSLLIGASAFCAGELVFKKNKQKETEQIDLIKNAKEKDRHILAMIKEINDEEVKETLREIHKNVFKIIRTIETKPYKIAGTNKFFDYYLPAVTKIIDQYDNIENQELSSKESKKFLSSTKQMLQESNEAFKEILNNLYQKDIIETNVEMKVLNSMLKSDGLKDDALDILDKENKHE